MLLPLPCLGTVSDGGTHTHGQKMQKTIKISHTAAHKNVTWLLIGFFSFWIRSLNRSNPISPIFFNHLILSEKLQNHVETARELHKKVYLKSPKPFWSFLNKNLFHLWRLKLCSAIWQIFEDLKILQNAFCLKINFFVSSVKIETS